LNCFFLIKVIIMDGLMVMRQLMITWRMILNILWVLHNQDTDIANEVTYSVTEAGIVAFSHSILLSNTVIV
jgi:hypothetical protein